MKTRVNSFNQFSFIYVIESLIMKLLKSLEIQPSLINQSHSDNIFRR